MMWTYLIITIVLFTTDDCAAQCPDGYEGHQDYCYKLLPVNASYGEAQRYCEIVGGQLAVINDAAQNTFVTNLLTRNKAEIHTTNVWIGGTDLLQEGTWLAPNTLQPLTYFHWAPGQPDNNSGEHCLSLFNSIGFLWDDFWCDRINMPLCQRPKAGVEAIVG